MDSLQVRLRRWVVRRQTSWSTLWTSAIWAIREQRRRASAHRRCWRAPHHRHFDAASLPTTSIMLPPALEPVVYQQSPAIHRRQPTHRRTEAGWRNSRRPTSCDLSLENNWGGWTEIKLTLPYGFAPVRALRQCFIVIFIKFQLSSTADYSPSTCDVILIFPLCYLSVFGVVNVWWHIIFSNPDCPLLNGLPSFVLPDGQLSGIASFRRDHAY